MTSLSAVTHLSLTSSAPAYVKIYALGTVDEVVLCKRIKCDGFNEKMMSSAKKGDINDIFFCRVCQTIFSKLSESWFDSVKRGTKLREIPLPWIDQFKHDFISEMPKNLIELDWVQPFDDAMAQFLFMRGYYFLEQFFSEYSLPPAVIKDKKPQSLNFCIGENLKRNPCMLLTTKPFDFFVNTTEEIACGKRSESIINHLSYGLSICQRLLGSEERCTQPRIISLISIMMQHVNAAFSPLDTEAWFTDEHHQDIEDTLLRHILHKPQKESFWNEMQEMIFARNYQSSFLFHVFFDDVYRLLKKQCGDIESVIQSQKPEIECLFEVQINNEKITIYYNENEIFFNITYIVNFIARRLTNSHPIVIALNLHVRNIKWMTWENLAHFFHQNFNVKAARSQEFGKTLCNMVKEDGHKKNIKKVKEALELQHLPRGQALPVLIKTVALDFNQHFMERLRDFVFSQAKDEILFLDAPFVGFQEELHLNTLGAAENLPKLLKEHDVLTDAECFNLIMKVLNYPNVIMLAADRLQSFKVLVRGKIESIIKNVLSRAPKISSEKLMTQIVNKLKGNGINLPEYVLKKASDYFEKNPSFDLKIDWEKLVEQSFEDFKLYLEKFMKVEFDKLQSKLVENVKKALDESLLLDAEETYKTFFFSPFLRDKNYSLCDFAIRYEVIELLYDNNGWGLGPLGALKHIRGIWEKKYPNFPFNEQHAHFFILELFSKKEKEAVAST